MRMWHVACGMWHVHVKHLEALALAGHGHSEHRLQAGEGTTDEPADVIPQLLRAADLACRLQRLEYGGRGTLGAVVAAVGRIAVLVVFRLLVQTCGGGRGVDPAISWLGQSGGP